MAKMKKNGFWIGFGVAGAAALGVFAGLILPKWGDASSKLRAISSKTAEINRKLKEMPGDKNLKAWQDHTDKLRNDYEAHVQVLERRDKELEKWFEALGPTSTYNEFMIRYGDQAKLLEKRIRDAGILVGVPREGETHEPDGALGFNWCSTASFKNPLSPDEQMEAKSQLQKRYWLCEYVAAAILAEGDAKPRRLIDVHFLHPSPIKGPGRNNFQDIHAGSASGGSGMSEELYKSGSLREQAMADRARMYAMDSPRGAPSSAANFLEYQLPLNGEPPEGGKPLGSTITFGVTMEVDYGAVPRLLRSFIAPRNGPELPVQVIGVNVFVPDQNPMLMTPQELESIDKTFKIPKFTTDQQREIQEWEKEFAARRDKVEPARARVVLLCQAIDFEPANRALTKKAPAAP